MRTRLCIPAEISRVKIPVRMFNVLRNEEKKRKKEINAISVYALLIINRK